MFINCNKHNPLLLFYIFSPSLLLLPLLRVDRESLESGLLDRQELASSLEADRARLEEENASLQQANETLTRESLQGASIPLSLTWLSLLAIGPQL